MYSSLLGHGSFFPRRSDITHSGCFRSMWRGLPASGSGIGLH